MDINIVAYRKVYSFGYVFCPKGGEADFAKVEYLSISL